MKEVEDRYSRQVLFRGIGRKGQLRIRSARVAVVGCGALGSAGSEMLARCGVGFLRLIDRDFVEWSNLPRQSLYDEEDARQGRPKAVAAAERLARINSQVRVEPRVSDLSFENVGELLGGVDVVLDGSDNFEARFLVNDYCVREGIPWMYGGAVGSYGLAMAVLPGKGPCLRCLIPTLPAAGGGDTCDTAGVIAPIVHVVVSYQATQVLRLLVGEQVASGLLTVDLWQDEWRRVREVTRRDDCECCRLRRFSFLDGEGRSGAAHLCGRNAVQVNPARRGELDLVLLSRRLESAGPVQVSDYLIRFQVGELEVTVFRDGRAIVKGTDDLAQARSIYSRYVGT